MKNCIPLLLLTFITFAPVAVAQSTKDKIEIGVQTTSLTLVSEFSIFDDTQIGIGGRVGYNFNRSIAAEAEVNFFPQTQLFFNAFGNAVQGQFGVKVGKRFEKLGLFGKVRPGFISVDQVLSFPQGGQVGPIFNFTIERKTFFTIDAGGVLELYPSKRTVVRFEAGDTAIRRPLLLGQVLPERKFNHNFQFTAGFAFRLGDFPAEDANVKTSNGGQDRTKRFEAGAQFTSLLLEPSNALGTLTLAGRERAEPGFGGRFTVNVTESIAFEAEGNYYTRERFGFPQGGHMFQGQFGGKVGKRFDKWGLFGKARPGFVAFTQVPEFPFFGIPTPTPPNIRFETKLYPSLDVGGVVEFYISPRWMARFDVGDTMIHYGEIQFPGGVPPFILQRSETTHNLQISSGIGFRF